MGALCGKVDVAQGIEKRAGIKESREKTRDTSQNYIGGDSTCYSGEDLKIQSKIVVSEQCLIYGGSVKIERGSEEEFIKVCDNQTKMVQDASQVSCPIIPFLDDVDKNERITHGHRLDGDQECFGPNADRHDDPSLANNTLSVEGTIMDALSVRDKSSYDSHPDGDQDFRSSEETSELSSATRRSTDETSIMKTPSDWHRAFEEERARAMAEDRMRSTGSTNQSTGRSDGERTASDWHRAFEEERARAMVEERIRSTGSTNQSTGRSDGERTASDWHRAFEEERARAMAEDRMRSTGSANQSTGRSDGERTASDWHRAFEEERARAMVEERMRSNSDEGWGDDVSKTFSMQPVIAELPDLEKSTADSSMIESPLSLVDGDEPRLPGLNRAHSNLEVQLAILLKEAQEAGSVIISSPLSVDTDNSSPRSRAGPIRSYWESGVAGEQLEKLGQPENHETPTVSVFHGDVGTRNDGLKFAAVRGVSHTAAKVTGVTTGYSGTVAGSDLGPGPCRAPLSGSTVLTVPLFQAWITVEQGKFPG
ncbi:hypothetical protein GUITHDRAFT_146658 [Guillardia theta CCMP2712]|uniref:Uncharacterized protein n=1 Tax=Guillardia theta (strain CCMP2712) TaxID=905079 RepID=L1IGP5_GUITC|nr:hypothetical protein GUITHDRAFT_146658 [Guillardia theta CCMP2712]EKX35252.1 hypothetical protein GUITHDRAFT_146658 [Guillardia theta CCMP2712]|eukprot:XP_005822232.1 hypothetical protein GUITHDRAFT_146658 [Guillardia theta CCMP2712]